MPGRGAVAGWAIFLAAVSLPAESAPPLAPGTLPNPAQQWVTSGQASLNRSGSNLTIQQTTAQTILNWQSFNVAPGSRVVFQQPNASAAALNRIFDANPSLIQGSLSSNGKVYLLNSNGIVFGDGAQINVGGLIASSLNLSDSAFLNGFLNVSPAFQGTTGFVRLDPGASIVTPSGGQVFLFAPVVENRGSITTPDGQTVLAAGRNLYLAASTDPGLRGILVQLDGGGTASNVGSIVAQRGNATIAGLAVNQGGNVSATTSVTANGSIYLVGSERPVLDGNGNVAIPARSGSVTFGTGSSTAVLPEIASTQTSTDVQVFTPSRISVSARSIEAQPGAKLQAHGGSISLQAVDPNGAAGGRIYLDNGTSIDASGTRDVPIAMARNFVDVQLNSAELADSPLQKGGFLQGKTVTVDVRQGTPLANISGAAAQTGRTVAERTAAGGSVSLVSDGDVVMRSGSSIDVSGGTLAYAPGYGSSTQLITQSGRVVDIGQAGADQAYTGFANSFTRTSTVWGATRTFTAPGTFNAGYIEGKNAGSISIQSPAAALDGGLFGHATAGIYQRAPDKLPSGGLLSVGDPGNGVSPPDFISSDIVLTATFAPLPIDFTASSVLPATRASTIFIAPDDLGRGGFGRLDFGSNGTIALSPGTTLDLGAQGSLSFRASRIEIDGAVRSPGGSVFLEEMQTARHSGGGIAVGGDGSIAVAGQWVNDRPGFIDLGSAQAISGGSVTMTSSTGVALAPGSRVDVSAGALYGAGGAIRSGQPGSIEIVTNRGLTLGAVASGPLTLGGVMTGYGFDAGGSLSLTAGSIAIGGTAGRPGEWMADPGALAGAGFQNIRLTGIDGVTIAGDTRPVLKNFSLLGGTSAHRSASDLTGLAEIVVWPTYQRAPVSLALTATDFAVGDIVVTRGTSVAIDPGGALALAARHQSTIDGALRAPGGTISVTMSGDPTNVDSDNGFLPGQSIWLGKNALLSTAGTPVSYVDKFGNRVGTVWGGGEIDVLANKGYIVAEPGSVLDVSGSAGTLDVLAGRYGGVAPVPRLVTSDAGTIRLQSREGILLGATLQNRTFADTASRGQFSLALDSVGVNPVGPSYPATARTVDVRADKPVFPGGLAPGAPLDTTAFNGRADVGAAPLGNFDSVSLKAADVIRFDGAAALRTRRSIVLDAPVTAAAAGASLKLDSSYLAVGNGDPRYQASQPATSGDGTLSAHAGTIDIVGQSATAGIGSMTLVADGDIRLQGVLPVDTSVTTLKGGLVTSASLTFAAAQVYPTTLSRFDIDAGASGVRVLGGRSGSTPLSAGGALGISAANIDIEGTLRAPFGSIALNAVDALMLGPGSLVSASGNGMLVPFGQTQNQTQWQYSLGNGTSAPIDAAPQKIVSLKGSQTTVAQGARIDLSGGGDMRAWEFLPGNGGSADVLAGKGVFAVLPGMTQAAAPRDWQNDAGSSLKPGDAVFLSGSAGFAAGVYTLLPAHYALLPGAYSVSVAAGTTDMVAAQNYQRLDGSSVVSGYRTVIGTPIADSRSQGFVLTPGTVVRRAAQYVDTDADTFFSAIAGRSDIAAAPLPRDGGTLSVSASNALTLAGAFDFSSAMGSGGRADISAPRMEIVSALHAHDGVVQITADSLSALGAQSLLLGGSRSGAAGDVVTPGAVSLVVQNDAAHALRAGDITLVASESIELAAGAAIAARGNSTAGADSLTLAGNAAVVRASAGGAANVVRAESASSIGGNVRFGPGASIAADGTVRLDTTGDIAIDPTTAFDSTGIAIGARKVALGDVPSGYGGLVVNDALLGQFGQARSLAFRSYGGIDFFGNVNLGTATRPLRDLTLDTGAFAGFGDGHVVVRANSIALNASAGSEAPPATSSHGTLEFLADAGDLTLGAGTRTLAGFDTTTLSTRGDLRTRGNGSFATSGDLALSAARVVADDTARYAISAGGAVVIAAPATSVDAAPVVGPGGSLSIRGARIEHGGRIEVPAGTVALTATGAAAGDGVHLASGSSIDVSGTTSVFRDVAVAAPAGNIALTSKAGDVVLDAGSRIDFSGAAGGGNAGSLAVSAVHGGFVANGAVLGGAATGSDSGAFALDAGSIANASALFGVLANGGVHGSYDLRARNGDLVVGATDRASAGRIRFDADAGRIDLFGTLIANPDAGGSISASAGLGLEVHSGAVLEARGTTQHAGLVSLAATAGEMAIDSGSAIDVSSRSGAADGSVRLRAPQSGAEVAVSRIGGTVSGASSIVLEAERTYTGIGRLASVGGAGVLTPSQVQSDVAAFLGNTGVIGNRLGLAADPRVRIVPGVEVQSGGDLTVASDWNIGGLAPGAVAGAFTLRAGGNLNVNGSLSSGFADATPGAAPAAGNAWTVRLTAGSDLLAADFGALQSVAAGSGNLLLGAGRLVRTGTGAIDMAAAGDVAFANGASAIYTSGNPAASLGGFAAPPGAYFAGGGGDVSIRALGSIVTAGIPAGQAVNDWLFRQGSLPTGVTPTSGSDTPYVVHPAWGVSFASFRENVGALGGGNVSLSAGRDIVNVSAVVPTSGTATGTTPKDSATVTLGGGNLSVAAGGDIAGGVYYVEHGQGRIRAGGELRAASGALPAPVLALGDATFDVAAGRGIALGGVFNPTLAPQGRGNVLNAFNDTRLSQYSTYTSGSAVRLLALTGDLTLADDVGTFIRTNTGGLRLPTVASGYLGNFALYPGTLDAFALQGNLTVTGDQPLSLYPQQNGNLRLLAGASVNLAQTVYMADVDPSTLARVTMPLRLAAAPPGGGAWTGSSAHAASTLHASDIAPVEVVALGGSIVGASDRPTAYLAKSARFYAGDDVRDVWLFGQNARSDDITAIEAGRDIVFSTPVTAQGQLGSNLAGLYWGGPGTLQLLAGRNVDLGSGAGVISRGNLDNPALPAGGADVLVAVGLGRDANGNLRLPASASFVDTYLAGTTPGADVYRSDLADFMARAGQPGLTGTGLLAAYRALAPERQLEFASTVLFSELRRAGESTDRAGFKPGFDAAATLFPGSGYRGDLLMYLSQIKTDRGGDIRLLTPGGLVNEGLAVPPAGLRKSPSELGIVTVEGGSIEAFVSGDFLVSQSRVFTLRGGDITIWSSNGSIDAGRGAKTTTYAPEPRIVTSADGSVEVDYNAAASGSGIGVLLTQAGIAPGRVDLIAPNGFVDAGEAGIRSVGDVHIAAPVVLNVGYIEAGGRMTGVPIDVAPLSGALVGAASQAGAAATSAASLPLAGLREPGLSGTVPRFSLITVEVLGPEDD